MPTKNNVCSEAPHDGDTLDASGAALVPVVALPYSAVKVGEIRMEATAQ